MEIKYNTKVHSFHLNPRENYLGYRVIGRPHENIIAKKIVDTLGTELNRYIERLIHIN